MRRLLGILLLGLLIAGVQATTCSPSNSTSGGYTTLTFTATGSCTWTVVNSPIEYLVVGGGGSGSDGKSAVVRGGGAGGGQVVANSSVSVSGTYTITVGAGGVKASAETGNPGLSSSISGLIIAAPGLGGGPGGGQQAGHGGTSGNGHTGGTTAGSNGGGGGGNSENGQNDFVSYGWRGGYGTASSITGTANNYSFGGGGDADATGGVGNLDTGGGHGGVNGVGCGNGTANNGDGGGGCYLGGGTNGGSGVVIIKYASATPPVAAFHASPLVVWRNGTIQFTDDTTNTPTSWDWYDPNTANPLFTGNLSNQNPKVFPRNWGYHSVNLIACNGAGCSTKASGPRYIYVLQPGVI